MAIRQGQARQLGTRLLREKLYLAVLLGTAATWLDLSLCEANGGDVHIGNLSSSASLAIMVIGVVGVGLFIGLFTLRWMQTRQASLAQPPEDDAQEILGTDSQDQR